MGRGASKCNPSDPGSIKDDLNVGHCQLKG